MANVDHAYGFRSVGRTYSGGDIQLRQRAKAVGLNAAIANGDIVARAADSTLTRTFTPGTTLISGVALNPGAALTLTYHQVIEQPDALFSAQADTGTAVAEADMGLNANVVLGTAANGISGDEIDADSKAVGATLDLHLIEKLDVPGNDYGEHVEVLVIINKHRMHGSAVGV